jgi:predicted nicotinamide N-methyase
MGEESKSEKATAENNQEALGNGEEKTNDKVVKTNDVDDDCLMELGFMFEGHQPTTKVRLEWPLKDRVVTVVLHVIDDEVSITLRCTFALFNSVLYQLSNVKVYLLQPGAVQSGFYLWPAAKMLSDYLVEKEANTQVQSVMELGAGCALASLTALQVWQPTLQCIVVTDHDAGVLERALENHESTLDAIYNSTVSEDGLDSAINSVGSIPVLFERLEWGDDGSLVSIRDQLLEHTTSGCDTVHVVLGSDLIYCVEVVEPLFQTATNLMNKATGRFLLSQSFGYDDATEETIDRICERMHLKRTILEESNDGARRIQEFRFLPEE